MRGFEQEEPEERKNIQFWYQPVDGNFLTLGITYLTYSHRPNRGIEDLELIEKHFESIPDNEVKLILLTDPKISGPDIGEKVSSTTCVTCLVKDNLAQFEEIASGYFKKREE